VVTAAAADPTDGLGAVRDLPRFCGQRLTDLSPRLMGVC
jgi:hypothetical protein